MAALETDKCIGVIGAGTMGAGIAQVAATAGHPVVLFDIAEGAAEKGLASIKQGLEKLVLKGKKSQADVDALCARITPAQELSSLSESALVIEAIVERLDIKRSVFAELETVCSQETIIASNTSSISVSALAGELTNPERLVGMHFFNPAAILKLVEVISGLHTSSVVADTVYDTAAAWGKTPVHAKSTPGFIVNRVARPFYAEGLRSLNEQLASVTNMDELMRSSGGFRMGPFQLMDLIGLDVNLSVSESVFQAYYADKRFQPSVLQAEMVAGGLLGRKSGRGFYNYKQEQQPQPEFVNITGELADVHVSGDLGAAQELLALIDSQDIAATKLPSSENFILLGGTRLQLTDGRTASQVAAQTGHSDLVLFDLARSYTVASAVAITAATQASEQALEDAAVFFSSLGKNVIKLKDSPGMLVMRTVCCLINEAADAVNQGVCKAQDVDTAMKLGVNYPEGPIEWGQRLGLPNVVSVLNNLQSSYGEERYRCSPWLAKQQYVV